MSLMRNNRLCDFAPKPRASIGIHAGFQSQNRARGILTAFPLREKKATDCSVWKEVLCVEQMSEVGSLLSRCPDPSGSPLGEKRAHAFLGCGRREVETKSASGDGSVPDSRTDPTVEARSPSSALLPHVHIVTVHAEETPPSSRAHAP